MSVSAAALAVTVTTALGEAVANTAVPNRLGVTVNQAGTFETAKNAEVTATGGVPATVMAGVRLMVEVADAPGRPTAPPADFCQTTVREVGEGAKVANVVPDAALATPVQASRAGMTMRSLSSFRI